MGYQSIWLQKRRSVLLTVCAGCKKQLHGLSKYLVAKTTSCVVSNLCLLQKRHPVLYQQYYRSGCRRWLHQHVATKVSGCKRWLHWRGYQNIWLQKMASLAWLPVTGIHYLVAKDTLCYQFQFYQVGRDVLCSPCMQQVGRDVLCSPHINSIGCRLQELYCAHHVFIQ